MNASVDQPANSADHDSTANSEDGKAENELVQTAFKLDRSKIIQSKLVDQLPLLAEIGVAAYDQDAFEAGVLEQVDDALRQTTTTATKSEENETVSTSFSISQPAAILPRSLVLEATSESIKYGREMPFDILRRGEETETRKSAVKTVKIPNEAESEDIEDGELEKSSESEYVPSEDEAEEEEDDDEPGDNLDEDLPSTSAGKGKKGKAKSQGKRPTTEKSISLRGAKDDGSEAFYKNRLKEWKTQQLHDRLVRSAQAAGDDPASPESEEFVELTGGLKILCSLWDQLYPYQKTGVRWLWDLHCQAVGGIIGDEMGLGKTIQIIAFLAALDYSQLPAIGTDYVGLGPVMVVCPTTVMHQWVREFHRWWPRLRIVVLHESGSYSGSRSSLARHIAQHGGVLITSYSTMTLERQMLVKYDWHYIILDEGHKIRNPDARVTVAAKQFRTPHRLILSGTPMQNSLKELWSLFDFVYPGRLGALPVFLREFGVPITQGGYANATEIQVRTAYRCACVLRDTISPYLLRRLKADVQQTVQLPSKNEQVLFCRLTDEQRMLYRHYLASRECESILKGSLEVFVGLISLRKLCNHPDLLTGGPNRLGDVDEADEPSATYGYPGRSGKMMVVDALLKLWQTQGHRVLLFSQSKQMLDIMEKFVKNQDYTYLRMDGGTPIGSRQNMVAKFNEDSSIFVFLLTTRVGGLGLNLIGADRVIIYDPDWNPSTDAQARERVWRIGQQRPVTIYRLLTTGTIEEKIYHRQIFKQFLTNRVLKDPKQRRFFKTNDLYELFTLADEKHENGTETGSLFAGLTSEINKAPSKKKRKRDQSNIFDRLAEDRERQKKRAKTDGAASNDHVDEEDIDFVPDTAKEESRQLTEERRKQLMEMARQISRKLGPKGISQSNGSGKRRDRKDKKFEGVRIPCLDSLADFRPPGSGTDVKEGQDIGESSKKHDDYVLRKLFKKSGIHSALRHDKIINDGDADYVLVEAEAENVARHAAEALEASRRLIESQSSHPGVLTWTGRHGDVGTTRPRFGPKSKPIDESSANPATPKESQAFSGLKKAKSSNEPTTSADLLAEIRNRKRIQGLDGVPAADAGNDRVGVLLPNGHSNPLQKIAGIPPRYEQLMNELRLFLVFGGKNADGRATTKEILDKFGNRIQSQDSAIFRSMLKRICDFERSSDGEGVWFLKAPYR